MILCFFCNHTFLSMKTLMLHIKVRHKLLMNTEVKCNFENCIGNFNNVYSLQKHILKIHSETFMQKAFFKQTELLTNDVASPSIIKCNIENSLKDNLKDYLKYFNLDILLDTVENTDKINIKYFKNIVSEYSVRLVTKLYAIGNLNRKVTHTIINDIGINYISMYSDVLLEKFKDIEDFDIFLNIIKNDFKSFKSEYRTLKYLQEINCLFLPKLVTVNSFILSFGKIKRKHQLHLQHQKLNIVPLKLILKKFLELPNVYLKILTHIEETKKSISLTSTFQIDFWKSIEENANDKFILPLILYFDDLEINNLLDSCKNKKKFGVVYCAIGNLPNEFSSLLENIFLVQLHNYQHHKVLGNKKSFIHVINQINELCNEDISINIKREIKKIYFVLSHVAGDNLGINTILGFTKSFNSSHCCRIYYISKDEMHKATVENSTLLRNFENYIYIYSITIYIYI